MIVYFCWFVLNQQQYHHFVGENRVQFFLSVELLIYLMKIRFLITLCPFSNSKLEYQECSVTINGLVSVDLSPNMKILVIVGWKSKFFGN